MSNKIHFILTGGTIDKIYDPVSQTNTMNEKSVVPDFIRSRIKPDIQISYEELCMLDSRDITDEMRKTIKDRIVDANTASIVITHGTDTMSITAEFLKENLPANHGKTIILTGSMVPINGFTYSDAGFNLGFAVAASQMLEPGVYLCMQGRVYEADNVEKDLKIARFVEK